MCCSRYFFDILLLTAVSFNHLPVIRLSVCLSVAAESATVLAAACAESERKYREAAAQLRSASEVAARATALQEEVLFLKVWKMFACVVIVCLLGFLCVCGLCCCFCTLLIGTLFVCLLVYVCVYVCVCVRVCVSLCVCVCV